MANLKEQLQTYLCAHAGIAALVSDRIYMAGYAPQDITAPYITYQKISSVRQYTHDGYSKTRTRMQITIFAATGESTEDILVQLYTAMEAMSEDAATTVDPVLQANEIDMYGYQEDLHQVPVDFIIYHKGV